MKKIITVILQCSSWAVFAMDPALSKVFQQRNLDIPCKLSFIAHTDNKYARYCVVVKLLQGDETRLPYSETVIDLARNLLQDKPSNTDIISGVFYSMENLKKTEKNYIVLRITVVPDSLILIKRCLTEF